MLLMVFLRTRIGAPNGSKQAIEKAADSTVQQVPNMTVTAS
jgi:hypothetical protein